MKANRFTIIIVLLFVQSNLFGQLVYFQSANYFVGDDVTAKVLTNSPFLVENDIRKITETFSPSAVINLGKITEAGFYKLHFKFSPTLTETYYIWTGKKSDEITIVSTKKSTAVFSDQKSVNDVFSKFATDYNKLDWKKIAKESLIEYTSTHVISGTVTITVCLSAGAVPALVPICIGNVKSEFKDMTAIVAKKIAMEMFDKEFISMEQKDKFIAAVNGISNGLDFLSAKGKLDKLLTAISITTDYATQNETIKLLIQQDKQLYDQTKIFIEFSKKTP